jgi:hypothetical protein
LTRVVIPDGVKYGGAVSLALRGDSAFAIEEGGALGTYDADGTRTGETVLPRGAVQAVPFADAWLVRVPGATHLAPSNAKPVKGKLAVFADGGSAVTAFAVAVDGVAVARAQALELWTHAGKLRWSVPGAWVAAAIVPGHVVALAEDGTLAFTAMRDGATIGTLHLASTEPATDWRLAIIDAARVVLALGDWLVWIDVATRKTIRRVRVRDKVTALGADAEWVVCATDTGWIQAFSADSGEAGGAFETEQGKLSALALGKKTLFTGGEKPAVRAFGRAQLDVAQRASAPVTALSSRGDLIAAGDGAGNVRVLRGGAEVCTRPLGEAITAVYLARGDLLVAATTRVILRLPRPWDAPRPLALRTPASAFAADEDYAFAGTDTGSVDVYDLATATHVTSYALSDGEVTALARLPGKYLVVGTGALDGRVFVVDVTEPKVVHRLEPHDEAFAVTCIAYDPRGRIVASGADDGSIALIDPAKGKVLARLRVRETPISLAFDGVGRRLACVFADGTAGLVKLGPRGATMEDIALTGAARVAWGDDAVFGFLDGRVERLAGTSKSEAPRARA